MTRAVRYASAPCGAGKTFQLVKRSGQLVESGGNVLLLQPTKLLIEKTRVDEFGKLADPPPIKVFHGDTVGANVGHQLAEYLDDPEDRPQVVMATHQAFLRLPFLSNASGWHLLIDEVPQVDRQHELIVPNTHPFITDHIHVAQHDGVYGLVKPKSPDAVRTLARNPDEDELLERFREPAHILTTKHWRSYAHIEQYHKLLAGKGKALNIHSVLMPFVLKDFASVLIAGANFEDTGLFSLWSKMGVPFVQDEEFLEGLKYRQHTNGHLATVNYALDRNWSRHLLEQSTDGKPNLDRLRDAAKLVIQDRDFLWQANNSVPNNFFKGLGQRLPGNPLGLNDFDTVDDIAFLSALNPPPAHGRFLQSRGLSSEEIERLGYCGVAYQAVMRTSLRDASDTTRKNIIVPDERLARYLAEMLPGATVLKMDTGIADQSNKGGRPRVHRDNAEKLRRRRSKEAEKRAELLAQVFLARKPQHVSDDGFPSDSAMGRNETPISLYRGSVSQDQNFWATIYSNIKSSTPEAYLSCTIAEHFAEAMAAAHGRVIETKAANPLFSPAIFDPDRSLDSNRGRDNILYLQNIVLDFENGDLLQTDVPNLFPDLQLIVTNSYGHTSDAPRFRVIILTSTTVSPTAYEALWDAVANKLKDAGYTKSPRSTSKLKRSGLDHSKRAPTSLFYLPAQAAEAADSFFKFYDDGHRRPLDPGIWLRNVRLETSSESGLDGNRAVNGTELALPNGAEAHRVRVTKASTHLEGT